MLFFLNFVFFIFVSFSVPVFASECDDIVEKLQIIVKKMDLLEEKIDSFTKIPVKKIENENKHPADESNVNEDGVDLSKKLFSTNSSEKDLYDQAYLFMKNGKYHDAESNFHSFISIFPNSKLIPNAHYWIADINYHVKNFRNSAIYFVKAYTADPTGVKAPISLFKLATSLSEMKEVMHSCSILNKLFRNFPDLVYSLKTQSCALSSKIKCENYEEFCM